MSEVERNIAGDTSPETLEVPANTEVDLREVYQGRKACRLIENVAGGRLSYVTASGKTVHLGVSFNLPRAIRPIEAQRILANTNVGLVVYF